MASGVNATIFIRRRKVEKIFGFLPIPPCDHIPDSFSLSLSSAFTFCWPSLVLSLELARDSFLCHLVQSEIPTRLGKQSLHFYSLVRYSLCILSCKLLPKTIISTRLFQLFLLLLKTIIDQKHIFPLLVVPLITFDEMLVQSKKDPHQFPQPHCSWAVTGLYLGESPSVVLLLC